MLPVLPLWAFVTGALALLGLGGGATWYWLLRGRPPSEAKTGARILVIGATGAGKTLLVNTVAGAALGKIGEGEPVTKSVNWLHAAGSPIWFGDTQGFEVIKGADQAANLKRIADWPDGERPHVVWVCVRQDSNRPLMPEIETARGFIGAGLPVIAVLTQADAGGHVREKMLTALREAVPQAAVVAVNAVPQTYGGTETIRAHGLSELRDATLPMVPEALRKPVGAAWRV